MKKKIFKKLKKLQKTIEDREDGMSILTNALIEIQEELNYLNDKISQIINKPLSEKEADSIVNIEKSSNEILSQEELDSLFKKIYNNDKILPNS